MGAYRERCARGDLARPVLVGDHIENQGNVDCLRAAAAMFEWTTEFVGGSERTTDWLLGRGVPIIAIENTRDAEDLWKYRPPDGPYAVVVGNERKGVSRALLRRADRVVQIPIRSTQLNCLNVAAAASVAIYRLAHHGRQIATRGGRSGGRPTILFAGVDDPIELGSAIRSAACFGWDEVRVADRSDVWFDADRVTRSLGRGAARRARNPIRVRPAGDETYDEVCVIGTAPGEPLRRADLACGPRQLIVLGDAGAVTRLAPQVRRIQIEAVPGSYPLRLVASIALAEVARQL